MHVPAGVVKQAEVARGVVSVEREMAPDVVRIRHSLGSDWSGDDAIFFRIVLSDRASREDRLPAVSDRVSSRLTEELNLADSGLLPYFSFRSESEQAILNDEGWS